MFVGETETETGGLSREESVRSMENGKVGHDAQVSESQYKKSGRLEESGVLAEDVWAATCVFRGMWRISF